MYRVVIDNVIRSATNDVCVTNAFSAFGKHVTALANIYTVTRLWRPCDGVILHPESCKSDVPVLN
jgi:hypothetical protein